MGTVFKTLLNNDVKSTRTLLHEAIPITGSIVSGTYAGLNIKNYAHGMFQSVYDYPYLSSSANHIFDIYQGVCRQCVYHSRTDAALQRNSTARVRRKKQKDEKWIIPRFSQISWMV